MTYLLLKLLHVPAAIVAVGANLTHGIWMTRASRSPDVLPTMLLTALLLYGFLGVVGLLGYTPTLRRQIQALDREASASRSY